MIPLCSFWSSEGVQWSNSNWTWAECELISEICQTWGTSQFPWYMADWKWNECSSSIPVVVIGNQPGVDANTLIPPWIEEPWNPYRAADREQAEKKRRRLIKLILKIKGQQYDEEKEVKNFNVTIGDIKAVIKSITNIDLKVQE